MKNIIFSLMIFSFAANANASSGIYTTSDFCPTCYSANQRVMYSPIPNTQLPSFAPSYYPWWYGYGSMSYSNFSYPAAWSGNGIMAQSYPYPSAGGCFAGKPNVYIEAPKGTEVEIQLDLQDEGEILSSIPSLRKEGWNMKVTEKGLSSKNGGNYPYIFYDYRLNEESLQDKSGFCTEKALVIPKLADILKQKGFKENEVKDFIEYWSVKMPESDKLCVYPQENAELEKVAKYVVVPNTVRIKRIVFLIIPKNGFKTTAASKFSKAPTEKWQPEEVRRPAAANESAPIEIREWGVAFLSGS